MYPQNLAQKLLSLPTTPFQHTVLKKKNRSVTADKCNFWRQRKGFSLHSNPIIFFCVKSVVQHLQHSLHKVWNVRKKFHHEMKRTDRSVDNIQPSEIQLGWGGYETGHTAECLVLVEDRNWGTGR